LALTVVGTPNAGSAAVSVHADEAEAAVATTASDVSLSE